MGVPAFFRWLSRKYPSIVVHCVEEKPKVINGVTVPVDSSQPNPNNFEFDNLYLDMNGIIHPCCHPENKPAPKDEDEMMVAIFEYIDRIFSIVRPRRLLYMAIDGVAPRAKMNQQRSRRFRASKESVEKVDEVKRIRDQLINQGAHLPPEKPKEAHFDSNCITPGTPFMDRLAKCLHYYIHVRLNTDPGWRNIEVILSDANVPGEGEHKIMNFIRKQRSNPDHDPNTAHCLCGADADLIMLGLATHEPNFTIIREEFKPNQPRPCDICGEIGHEMQECTGLSGPLTDNDKPPPPPEGDTEFIFLRLNVLREYLEEELVFTNLPFEFDLERAIDDWVFMCFFVGNDFLPHLPSLEIREGAIDRLVEIYKRTVHRIGGFITNSGFVEMDRVHLIMKDLGDVEDEIFKKRQQNELEFKRREKNKRRRLMNDRPRFNPRGQYAPQPISRNPSPIQNAKQLAMQMRKEALSTSTDSPDSSFSRDNRHSLNDSPQGFKRKSDVLEEEEEEAVQDDVRLWEDGFKERYYEVKFEVSPENIKFRHQVANAYGEGLCWVLRYYYQGCASWNWYFPYHYAPFASDFKVRDLKVKFDLGEPFKPIEQLMGVFPAASKQHVPEPFGELMCTPDSPIIDFYPIDFKIDLNGKKYAWQGVALLPFVDEVRLHAALKDVYPLLTAEEKRRNVRGDDRLYVREGHPSYDFFLGLYESGQNDKDFIVDTSLTHGMGGTVLLASDVVRPRENVSTPLPNCEDQSDNRVVCIRFRDPLYQENFVYPAKRLPKAVDLPKVLKPKALRGSERNYKPQIGMAPARQQASLDPAGNRMLRHSLGGGGGGAYSNVPPPSSLDRGSNRGGYNPNRRSFPQSNYSDRSDNRNFRTPSQSFPSDRSFSQSPQDRSFNDSFGRGGFSRDMNTSQRDNYYLPRSNNGRYANNSSPWDNSLGRSSSESSLYSSSDSRYSSPAGSRNSSFGSSRYSPYPSPTERNDQRADPRSNQSNFPSRFQRGSFRGQGRDSSGGSSGGWYTLETDPRKNSSSSQNYPPRR